MPEITIATLNLFNRQARWPQRASLIVRQFLEIKPDVIGLQEVDPTIDQANGLVHWINGELGRQNYVAYHMGNPRGGLGFESLAIVTRLPVVEHEGLDFLLEDNIAHRVRLQVASETTLDFYNTHLYWIPSKEGGEIRHKQAQRLLDWVAAHNNDGHQVLVGDFNAVPTGHTIALIKERFRSAHETANGQEAAYTWPSPLVFTVNAMMHWGVAKIPDDYSGTLDHIFVSPRLEVVEARVVFNQPDASDKTLYPSDHFGLMARLRVG